MADDREALGRIVHEQRLAKEAEDAAIEGRHKFNLKSWENRTPGQREGDMRSGYAAFAEGRRAAEAELAALRMFCLTVRPHLPAIRSALYAMVRDFEYESMRKPYRAALEAVEALGVPAPGVAAGQLELPEPPS